jgi:hypothetical protein
VELLALTVFALVAIAVFLLLGPRVPTMAAAPWLPRLRTRHRLRRQHWSAVAEPVPRAGATRCTTTDENGPRENLRGPSSRSG